MRVRQFQKRNEDLKEAVLHLKRMRKQNKKLFDDKHQLQKISLNADDRQTEIHEMLNVTFENSIDAMKKSNNVNKDVRIDDEVRSEAARDTAESLNTNSQIFKNDVTDDNLSNSKTRDIRARIKFSTRRFNRLIEIENSLSSVERSTSTAAFSTIDEISIEKE